MKAISIDHAAQLGAFALVVGPNSGSASSAGISKGLEQQLEKLGGAPISTPSGYVSLSFLFFVLAVSLFACSQVAAIRHEEGEGRLETLLALLVGRRRWLAGRLLLAAGGAAAIALAAGALAWAGAESRGVSLSLGDMVAAGANCLPAALLFLGIGALAFAVVPRAAAGAAYGLVLVAFLWQLFGALLDVPAWTLGLSPFHQVGLVPAETFKATAAAVMLALAAVAGFAAVRLFERRDLAGG